MPNSVRVTLSYSSVQWPSVAISLRTDSGTEGSVDQNQSKPSVKSMCLCHTRFRPAFDALRYAQLASVSSVIEAAEELDDAAQFSTLTHGTLPCDSSLIVGGPVRNATPSSHDVPQFGH